jgi:hypothetical protein
MVVEHRIHRAQLLADPPPETEALLTLARRAADSNGYADLHLAARAARLALEAYVPAEPGLHPDTVRSRGRLAGFPASRFLAAAATLSARVRGLWRRYPLLALFLAWFGAGLPAALFFRWLLGVWGVGFLVLTAAGFLVSVSRSPGRRPGSG